MNKWKSASELDTIIKSASNREKLSLLYGISLFVENAFFAPDFKLSSNWSEIIKLTEHALDYVASLEKADISLDEPTKHFLFLQLFYHRDLFIDHESTDIDAVLNNLSAIHKSGSVRWPYVFGNELYHKFNDMPHSTKTNHLDCDQASILLENTPQGVFQVDDLVSGPLGFIRGEEKRILPPTLSIPLWHCSDPGCLARHMVSLRQFDTPLQAASKAVIRHIMDSFGPSSEWHKPLLRIHRIDKWPNGRPLVDLPAVIGDCVIGEERTALLKRAMRSKHNSLLLKAVRNCGISSSSPEEIALNLTPEQQHQLLLLLPDESIVSFLDELIAGKHIDIPPSETREAKTYTYGPPGDTHSRLTRLGTQTLAHPPIIELSGALWSVYETLEQTDDLLWRLRDHKAATPRHSLVEYIRSIGPREAIKNLVLPSRNVTTMIFEKCGFTKFTDENLPSLIDRLLWKFGFNLPRYEEVHQLLRDRLEEFQSCVLQLAEELSEDDRARVRSVGVNVFVSVEEFLENLVSYNVWLLSSDHPTGSNFRYTPKAALQSVEKLLGKEINSGSMNFQWSTDGDNTLGTLLSYFQAYLAWLKQRPTSGRISFKRSRDDFPHYSKDTVLEFPFRHNALWADVPTEVLSTYIELIENIVTQFAKANLPSVRNGLDHKRTSESFPTPDQMLACISRLRRVAEIADNYRLIPKLYWRTKCEYDRNGNSCDIFQDYRGVSVELWNPPLVLGGPKKQFGIPYLIAPIDLLNLPNSMLCFLITSKSPYSEYWVNYPRRRFIPPKEDSTENDLGANFEVE